MAVPPPPAHPAHPSTPGNAGAPSPISLADSLLAKFDFRWDVLDVIISGKSALDSPHGFFQVQNPDEADRFLLSYGYDLENPIEKGEVLGNFHEALNFVRKNFLQPDNPEGLKLEIPRKILELTDIRDLLQMASKETNQLRSWACSLLKVMHTIAHIDKDLRSPHFSDIQTQIFDRFYKFIHRDPDGKLFLGEKPEDPQRINLVAFETKPKKSRDSIILKLLHKPENVAEDIFDRVGIRFVTETALDALRVVKYLRDRMIVMPPNIKPSRSRNTLVDLDDFRNQLVEALALAETADRAPVNESEVRQKLETAAHAPAVNPDNPHSSEFYRAIQFTCRQLIKLRNPLFNELRELKSMAKARLGTAESALPPGEGQAEGDPAASIERAVERIDLKHIQREIRFFYPYEVQVVDQKSSEENERGRSAHSEYKRSQVQTAMRRVMGTLATQPASAAASNSGGR